MGERDRLRGGKRYEEFASSFGARRSAGSGGFGALRGAAAPAQAQDKPLCSVWLVESGRFMDLPMGGFMPDRAFIPGSNDPMHNINAVDLPVNVGVIKCGSEVILYDTGLETGTIPQVTYIRAFRPVARPAQAARS